MSKVDELQVAAWTGENLGREILLHRFRIPFNAHGIMAEWCRERTGRAYEPIAVALRGLHELLAWFVPPVAFMRTDKDEPDGTAGLTLYFLDPPTESDRASVQTGLAVWLGILYPEKDPSLRTMIAATARDPHNWGSRSVSTSLRAREGACAVPEDPLLWDALVARAVGALGGHALRFSSGDTQVLVARTHQSNCFNGVELAAFPPKQDPVNEGLWTQILTVSAATFPERAGIHVLIRPSIRNWGVIRRWDAPSASSRRLDAFMRSESPGMEGHRYRHTSFAFRASKGDQAADARSPNERPAVVARWLHKEDQRLVDLLHRLSGKPLGGVGDVIAPSTGEDGLWLLPRLSKGNGDRNLSGGSGTSWPDRIDIVQSLVTPLVGAGFVQAPAMFRRKGGGRRLLSRPFNAPPKQGEKRFPLRRQRILRVLAALGNKNGILDLHLFRILDGSKHAVVKEVQNLFGKARQGSTDLLRWEDGLSIRIVAAPSGPLAEILPRAELDLSEKAGRNERQQVEIRKTKQAELNAGARARMTAHVAQARDGASEVGCALLEMPEAAGNDPWRDPYALARRELARARLLPQVMLIGEKNPEAKLRMGLRDCLRMLGVVPVREETMGLAPAAMVTIQRNDHVVGGGLSKSHAFPLAARVRGDVLECALPAERDEPAWMPYAAAALKIFAGEYGKFGRGRQEENVGRFETFFGDALEQIEKHGPCLVLVETESIAQHLRAFENGQLRFDELRIGSRTFSRDTAPNLRLIRTSAQRERLPSYYHETDAKWPSGLFTWSGLSRTFYGLKKKPKTVSYRASFASVESRFDAGERSNGSDIPLGQLDEICVLLHQEGDDPEAIAQLVHRLRHGHVQYDDDTSAPFPLHELQLLAKSVTL